MRRTTIGWIMQVALGIAVLGAAVASTPGAMAQPDPRGQAREHYLAGKRLYDAGNYPQAIAEFTQADQLAPSGVNEFNIALCHDKLGNAADAVAHYQAYLVRVLDAANRAQVEQAVTRLQAAAAAAQQKAAAAAAEQKAAADAAAAKRAADEALVAQQKAAEEAAKRAAEDAAGPAGPATAAPTTVRPVTPSTGDPELDRVAAIDVNAIRDQRPQVATAAGAAGPDTPATGTGPTTASGNPAGPAPEAPPKAKPVYKKWWFWAIIGVGAIVAVNVLSSSPTAQPGNTRALLPAPTGPTGNTTGLSLIHF